MAYSTLITHDRSHLLRSSDTWASTALTWWKNELHWLCVVPFVWRRQNTSNSYWILVQVNCIHVIEYPQIISSSGLVFLNKYATAQLFAVFSFHICFYRINSSSQSEFIVQLCFVITDTCFCFSVLSFCHLSMLYRCIFCVQ